MEILKETTPVDKFQASGATCTANDRFLPNSCGWGVAFLSLGHNNPFNLSPQRSSSSEQRMLLLTTRISEVRKEYESASAHANLVRRALGFESKAENIHREPELSGSGAHPSAFYLPPPQPHPLFSHAEL